MNNHPVLDEDLKDLIQQQKAKLGQLGTSAKAGLGQAGQSLRAAGSKFASSAKQTSRVVGNTAFRRGKQFLDQILMNRFGSASAKGRYTIQLVAHDMLKRWLAYAQTPDGRKNWRIEQGKATPRTILQFIHDTYGADPRAVPNTIRLMKANQMLPPDFEFEAANGRNWGGGDTAKAAEPAPIQQGQNGQQQQGEQFTAERGEELFAALMDQNATNRDEAANQLRSFLQQATKANPDVAKNLFNRLRDASKGDSNWLSAETRSLLVQVTAGYRPPRAQKVSSDTKQGDLAGAVRDKLTALIKADPTDYNKIRNQISRLHNQAQKGNPQTLARIRQAIEFIVKNPNAQRHRPDVVRILNNILSLKKESAIIVTMALMETVKDPRWADEWHMILQEAADPDAAMDRPKLMQFFLHLSYAYVKTGIVKVKLPSDAEDKETAGIGSGGGRSRGAEFDDDETTKPQRGNELETAMGRSNMSYNGRKNFDSVIRQAKDAPNYDIFKNNVSALLGSVDATQIIGKDDPLRAVFLTVKAMQ